MIRSGCVKSKLYALVFISCWGIFCPMLSMGQKEYVVGPRDVINLKVYAGGKEYQNVDLTVSNNGTINVPLIGTIKTSGLTVQELEKRIYQPFEQDYYVDPQIHLVISEYHSLHYYIAGAVSSPGVYETTSPASLMELIAKAGGVLPERGNVAYILRGGSNDKILEKDATLVVQKSKDPLKVDLLKLLDQGNLSCNVSLEPGDLIYIPPQKTLDLASSKIYVEGRVDKPGVYDFSPGLTALSACLLAGGFDKFAAPNRASIIRRKGEEQTVIQIDLNDVKTGKISDPELEPGDRIHIPKAWF